MNRHVATVLAMLLLSARALAQQLTLSEARALEAERAEALRLGDIASADAIYAGDFIGISRTGEVVRKPELLETLRRRGVNTLTFEMLELEVRSLDGLAFLLGRHVGRDAAGRTVREGRVLHVYAKRGDRWQIVSAQATPIVRD
jgi:ketosteroid isomerase-like protein